MPRLTVSAFTLMLAASAACVPAGARAGWSGSFGALELRAGIDTYTAYYSMSGTWWNLAATASPGFDKNRGFAEFWVQPKLDGRFPLCGTAEAYGAVSVGATQTLGSDAFDYTDQGAVRFGSALLGARGTAADWRYTSPSDVSCSRSAPGCSSPPARSTATRGAEALRRSARSGATASSREWAGAN